MDTLILEDHALFREALENICARELPHARIVGAADGASALDLFRSQSFTLLVLDLGLPDIHGFAVAGAMRRMVPQVRIIIVTSYCDDYTVYRAEKLGVQGFVDKTVAMSSELRSAVAQVAAGSVYFGARFLRIKAARLSNPLSFDKILSDREMAILVLIATPFTDGEIALELGISPSTVEKHRFTAGNDRVPDSRGERLVCNFVGV